MQAGLLIIWIMLWGVMHVRWRKYAPYMALIPCLMFAIISNMQIRSMLPEFLRDHSYRSSEEMSLIILILSLLINYNSFLVTVFYFTPVLLTTHTLQITEKVNFYFNGRTGERLSESEELQYKWEYMFRMVLFVGLFMMHHYLTLLDLSKLIIEKCMTAR